jgi:integrase
VARRRFQKGSVYLNTTGTVWLGAYAEYVLDSGGIEQRRRKQIVLTPASANGKKTTKREAQRILQPYLDRVNSSLASPTREHKAATFEAFAEIWRRDYLSLCKPSTRSGMRGHLTRLNGAFGKLDMRHIDAGHIQRLIASMKAAGLDPKTIRNLWATIRLIWSAALAQRYVNAVLPNATLPRLIKKKPRFFPLEHVAQIIAAVEGEQRVFYWLAAETGLRQGELMGLRVADIQADTLTVSQSVWSGKAQQPKTDNAVRTIALSTTLASLLLDQMARQHNKGHEFLFTASTGSPWDANVFRKRKFHPLLRSLKIPPAGFHAFRHFNVSLLDALRVPLKVIQERIGHALTGSFTLDVYGHKLSEQGNVDAARLAGEAIQSAVDSVCLTAITENGHQSAKLEAVDSTIS